MRQVWRVARAGSYKDLRLIEEKISDPAEDEVQIDVRDKNNFHEQLKQALSRRKIQGLDIVLDSVAGPFFQAGYKALQPMGRLIILGAANWMPSGRKPNFLSLGIKYLMRPQVDILDLISDNKRILGFNLIWLWDRVDELSLYMQKILAMDLSPPYVGHEFSFQQAMQAMRLFQSGKTTGKIVLKI